MASPDAGPRTVTAAVERWVPGVRVARTYDRSWLRPDVVAGVVLAAILVPQGMAYAELAGLPAVTGLYTTIACLVGYALFGPSRVLVLGPDSSISPLILAAITPLLVGGDPERRSRWPGCSRSSSGSSRSGSALGKLGFVADLLSKEVQVGYMNGLAITIIVGQLPKLFGFSTDADGFLDEVKAFFEGLDQTHTTTLVVGLARARRPAGPAPRSPPACRRSSSPSSARPRSRRPSACQRRASPRSARCRRASRARASPGPSAGDVVPLLIAALGITLVSLTDTIATATSFAARRGDEVEPDQEMIGIGAANVAAGLFQGFAVSTSGSRTAVAEQSGAKSQLTGLVGAGLVAVLLLFLNSLLADLPQTALAAVVIAAALSLMDLRVLAPLLAGAPQRGRHLAGRHRRRRSCSACCRASSSPSRWRSCCSSVATGGRTARSSARSTDVEGWHGVGQYPDAESRSRDRRLPLGGAAVLRQRGHLPRADPPARARPPAALGRPAVRGDHRRRRHRGRRCSSSSTTSSTPPGSTSPSPSCAAASRTSRCATGCSRRSTATTSTRRSRRR